MFRYLMRCAALLAALFFTTMLKAQEKYTINGKIQDAANGEELIGASVLINELGTGASSNLYGFYSITLPAGEYNLTISYIGFDTQNKRIKLDKSINLDIEMVSASQSLNEVVVSADREDANVTSTEMGVNKVDVKEIAVIPVIFGESDILKTIQLLPGIKSSEGVGGIYVRGGSSDQNLILLDEAPVYNASHLLGFFSVFNSDAIKDLKVYKGHIPAEYGGRASSVLDIKMKDGNNKKFNASGGIGLISSRLTLEAPFVKDKGSFILSGRRTYADVFLKLSKEEDLKNSILYFYDLNAKANYRFGRRDKLMVSGYFGRDKFGFSDVFGFDWGNTTATVRWNHLFNDRLFLNTTALFSDYNYVVKIAGDEDQDNGFKITSAIQDYSLKEDFDFYINPSNTLKFGLSGIYHIFLPGEIASQSESSVNSVKLQNNYAWEAAAYVSEDMNVNSKLNLNFGLRYSWFAQVGPGTIYTYDADGDIASSEYYSSGEIVQTYGGFEPRIGATYLLSNNNSIKASYGRNQQYLHLLSNSSSGTPIDVWIPSSNNVKPQIADQVSLGYFQNFRENTYETSVEVYYKNMQNQIDYKTGAELIFNENVESQLLFGKGWSYGAEFYVKKNIGNLGGWISYTWATTERKFDEVNSGNPYPASWDRRHDLAVVAIYKLGDKWTVSSTFVYQTGSAVTFPVGKYTIENNVVNLYDDRNGSRLPDYNRLDLGATWQLKKKEKYESSLTFSIYNVYARKNAFSIDFRENASDPTQTEAVKLSLFSIVPSITYNFKFK